MIKRKKYILFALILTLCIGVVLIIVFGRKNNTPDVKAFSVSDYQYYIDNFSSEENLGNISDAKDAITKAEALWIKTFGKYVKKEKPYQIFYDTENEIWLIHGSLEANVDGGVASILIENNTGKVLALWHSK